MLIFLHLFYINNIIFAASPKFSSIFVEESLFLFFIPWKILVSFNKILMMHALVFWFWGSCFWSSSSSSEFRLSFLRISSVLSRIIEYFIFWLALMDILLRTLWLKKIQIYLKNNKIYLNSRFIKKNLV